MKLSRAAIHRPIFTIMVVLIVIILGGIALSRLPIDLMPDISNPTLSISTSYENASPEEVEELISRPIEEAVSAVTGVQEVSSTSSEGNSNVRVTFTWGTDLDAASNDIRDRLDRVVGRLPDDADRPTLRKFDLASFPVMFLGASSRLDPVQMRQLIEDEVKYRIERVPGVAALDIWGGLAREIHVDLDADKIKALGLPLDQITERIRAANVNLPAGSIERGSHEVTVRVPGEYTSLDQLRGTAIAERDGVPIPLSAVAEVSDSWQRVTRLVRVNGQPGLRLAVNKQSGTNTVEVAAGVMREIEGINRDLPQIRLVPIVDSSEFIKRAISNVTRSALLGGVLAVVVLLFFLRSLRSTAVIAAAIPVSIVAAFALMYFAGFTINLMTLGGLALGIGMLVDNAIVVLENIYRLRERGASSMEAAVKGSEEVTAPIIASTLTTVVVFLPLIFVRGMAGVMFKQLAIVIAFALLCALAAALTLVPMLASRLLRRPGAGSAGGSGPAPGLSARLLQSSEGVFQTMESAYKGLLHVVLNHRVYVTLGALLALGASLLLVPLIGSELMPQSDEGDVSVDLEMEVGTRLELTAEALAQVEDIVRREVPEIKSMVTSAGGRWGTSGSHSGDINISLVPLAQRNRSNEAVAVALHRKLSGLPGATIRVRASQGFIGRVMQRSMGAGGSDRLQVQIRGHDLATAEELARRVQGIVREIDGVTDARLSRDIGTPEDLVVIDRLKAADMRLTVRKIAETLQTVLSGTRAGNYREGGDEYTIRVQVAGADRMAMDEVLDLTVTNSAGEPVVLRNVVSVQPRRGPVSVARQDQERITTVSANFSGRDMGSIYADLRTALAGLPVPQDFSIVFGGEYEEQQKAFAELLLGFVLALVLVYMVMACQYESLRDPFVVMFSVPMAAIGVLLMLFLTGTTLNIQSFIGCIMLGGIVVNNAILLVDTINLLRRRDGLPLREAIEEAGRRRLRPILMTTLTTLLALTPMALGIGEGGAEQAPMARAVIGGLASSTLITLIFVPVVYSLFEGLRGQGGEPAQGGAR